MMFPRAFLTAAVILSLVPTLCLAASASAPPSPSPLDPKCPPGTRSGFESSIFQFTGVPAERFSNTIGSFFHSEWYTGPLNSTHGTDNTIGATRSGTFSGTQFTERLVGYSRSGSDELTLRWVPGGSGVFEGIKFASYTEELRVLSICAGRGAYISMTAVYCVDKAVEAYAFFERVRRETVGAVAKQLGAAVFAGTCPVHVGRWTHLEF